MRTFLLALLGISALVFSTVAAEESDCDMKTIVKMRYCTDEERLLEKNELVSNAKYYVCPDCEGRFEKSGKCPDCEDPKLVEKTTGKDACKYCFGETVEVEACEKTYYVCEECGDESAKPGKCSGCDESQEMKKEVSHALIVYVCEDCGMTSLKPGKCTDEECDSKGKALVKTCSQSGNMPHVR